MLSPPGLAWFTVFRGGGCGKGAMKTRNGCRVHLWTTTQLLTSWATSPNSSLFPPQSKRVSNAKDLHRESRLFTIVLPKWGPWSSSINITWELFGRTDSQAPPRPPKSETLGVGVFSNKPFTSFWCRLQFENHWFNSPFSLGPRDDHTKRTKSERKRQMPYDVTYM